MNDTELESALCGPYSYCTVPQDDWVQYTWLTSDKEDYIEHTIYGLWIDTSHPGDPCPSAWDDGTRALAGAEIQWWSFELESWVTAAVIEDQTDDWTYEFDPPIVTAAIRLFEVYSLNASPMIYEWEVYECMTK
jgi:hypothetical protein